MTAPFGFWLTHTVYQTVPRAVTFFFYGIWGNFEQRTSSKDIRSIYKIGDGIEMAMSVYWIMVESGAVLIESFLYVYFLNKRYINKIPNNYSLILFWTLLSIWGIFATFMSINQIVYEVIYCLILFSFLVWCKQGTLLQKALGSAIVEGLSLATTIICMIILSSVINTSVSDILDKQDMLRLMFIVITKGVQCMVFLPLANRHLSFRGISPKPVIILFIIEIACFSCLLLIWRFILTVDISSDTSYIVSILAVLLLTIIVLCFFMHELFVQEKKRSVELETLVNRQAFEAEYHKEMEALYSDLRLWKHEYNNNLIAIRGYLDEADTKGALEYINSIQKLPLTDKTTLQTNSPALNSVVSTKLAMAQSQGIDVSIKAFFPKEITNVTDSDLCSICGNLLDNAIEACNRMSAESDTVKFISFNMRLLGKNLLVTVKNSYNGKIKRDGDRFLTMKKKDFSGLGLVHIDRIVDLYEGTVLREYDGRIFTSCVNLPMFPYPGGKKRLL